MSDSTHASNPFEQPDWPLEPCAGDTHTDDQGRLWTFCAIESGSRGSRWAYAKVIGKPWMGVIADTRQHLPAVHFAGMLAVPWDGVSKLGWVLDKAHCQPAPERMEPAPPDTTRFERLENPPSQDE